jgi:hypothetical protein
MAKEQPLPTLATAAELKDITKVFYENLRALRLPVPSFMIKYTHYLESVAIRLATEREAIKSKKEGD